MNKYHSFFLFAIFHLGNVSCQTKEGFEYVLSKELIRQKISEVVQEKRTVVGVVMDKIVIPGDAAELTEEFFLFDEKTQQLTPYLTLSNVSEKVSEILFKEDKIVKKGFMSIPKKYWKHNLENIPIDSFPYQEIWFQKVGMTSKKIDTYPFHYIDKFYEVNFSMDGRYLIVTPYTDVSAGYWPEFDDRFYLYNLEGSQIGKQTIKCDRCMEVNLIGDKVIFVEEIEIGGGWDGYYKNIYIAPKENIRDTIKIAHNINIIQLSPDGRFILGEKYLHGEYVPVIIDVASRRFQYLLGREYPTSYAFYSPYEKRFAFDFGTHFVYVDFPTSYPFDALNQKVNRTSKEEDAAFWKRFQHEKLN